MAKYVDAKGWMNDDRLMKRQKVPDNSLLDEEIPEVPDSEVIVHKPLKCKCESKRVHCYGADRPVLYYKCLDCGHKFKVIERD